MHWIDRQVGKVLTMSSQHRQIRLTVDPGQGTVSGPGGRVRLEPKVMQVLLVLGRYAGHVVSRDTLLDHVWPDVVVTDYTLSRCIYQLREKLGGITDGNREIIETLPKRGYRLLAEIEGSPTDLRVSGGTLLIQLHRRNLLYVGVVLFIIVTAVIIAALD